MNLDWQKILTTPLTWIFNDYVTIEAGQVISSPFGYVYLFRNKEALVGLTLSKTRGTLKDFAPWPITEPIPEGDCVSLLKLPAIPVCVRGTPFQRQVWKGMTAIPMDELWSYKMLACSLGLTANYSRAVGSAVGANPICLLVPCHRVIASDGTLGGYRWSLALKKAILDYEKEIMNNS